MVKKLIRKPLGNDKLIINILSLKPQTISVKIVDVTTNRVLSQRMIIPRKKQSRLVIDLPYRDYVLGVYVSSLSNDRFRAKVFLKSDKFYMSATGNSPMTSFAQTNASGVSGGGNIATTQAVAAPPSETSVVFDEIIPATFSLPPQLSATYTNAYNYFPDVTVYNTAAVMESDDGIGSWTLAGQLLIAENPSLPYTGVATKGAALINNKYYKIRVKDSAGGDVDSNALQYLIG